MEIGSSLTSICSYAFSGATALTTVTGCANLTGIGDNTFYGDKALASVAGCTKVTRIGKKAFYNCAALTKVGATADQIKFAAVKTVGENAFSGCKKAGVIDFGSKLTTIGESALKSTSGLKSLYIRSTGLKTAGADAFKGINASAIIYVPKTKVTSYKNGVLKGKGATLPVKGI